MGMPHTIVFKNDSIRLSVSPKGEFYLWDCTKRMNLAMDAKSERDAFVLAIEYYQKRSIITENQLKSLQGKVLGFVELFVREVDYGSSTDIPSTVLEINV